MTSSKPEPRKKKSSLAIWLILLAFLLLWLMQWRLGQFKQDMQRAQYTADSLARVQKDSAALQDSMSRLDSIAQLDSILGDSATAFADSVESLRQRRQDSLDLRKARANSGFDNNEDSLQRLNAANRLALSDSLPPSPTLVPPPGRYYTSIKPQVQCGEPRCEVFITASDTLGSSTPALTLSQSGLVWYKAIDSAGNASPWQKGDYDIASGNRCGENAYTVPVGGRDVCVDAYEWPNRPGERPQDMVTHEEASRLCSSVGKRLCSIEEWQSACKGKDNLRYPYGNRYDQTRCVTVASEASRTGRRESCRSWWGMYDMSGNLWEWTATPHAQRDQFFLVAGGSWNAQNASQCGETKFSFYPQNQYPFVGFRCCK